VKAKKVLLIALLPFGLLFTCCLSWAVFALLSNRVLKYIRVEKTENITRQLGQGLEAFKADWGVYPPSHDGIPGAREYGYQNLLYYLLGPEGKGWGKSVNEPGPFGGEVPGQYGPYCNYVDEYQPLPPREALDIFKPRKPILYFRFDPDRDPPYDVRDNPHAPSDFCGFASQEQFELLVRPKDAEGKRKWVREDYLLISPGPDGVYGYAVRDRMGYMRAARPEEVEKGEAVCDDITNFDH
jgi:hypothetical protein